MLESLKLSAIGGCSSIRRLSAPRSAAGVEEKLVQNGPVIKNPFIGGLEKLVQNLEKLVQNIDFSF